MEFNDETEWDIESIKRYEKLLMFESEYPIRQMELMGTESWLCCLGDKKSTQTTVMTVYSLPPRLKVSNKKASLSPNFDLKITAGILTKSSTTEIACTRNDDYLFTSEDRAEEILIYRLNTNQSDKLVMSGGLNCEGISNPKLSVINDFLVATKDSDTKISLIDFKSKTEIGKRKWTGSISCTTLRPLILSHQHILIYSVDDGNATVFDTRQQQPSCVIKGGENVGWSAGCAFEEGFKFDSNNIAFISNLGTVKLFDMKNCAAPFSQLNLGTHLCDTENRDGNEMKLSVKRPNIKLNPSNENQATVSGLDSRLYVLDTKPNCSIAFIHDGHEHMESCLGSDTLTTSHTYFTPGGDRTLISSADNSSINCWTFNIA